MGRNNRRRGKMTMENENGGEGCRVVRSEWRADSGICIRRVGRGGSRGGLVEWRGPSLQKRR